MVYYYLNVGILVTILKISFFANITLKCKWDCLNIRDYGVKIIQNKCKEK